MLLLDSHCITLLIWLLKAIILSMFLIPTPDDLNLLNIVTVGDLLTEILSISTLESFLQMFRRVKIRSLF